MGITWGSGGAACTATGAIRQRKATRVTMCKVATACRIIGTGMRDIIFPPCDTWLAYASTISLVTVASPRRCGAIRSLGCLTAQHPNARDVEDVAVAEFIARADNPCHPAIRP